MIRAGYVGDAVLLPEPLSDRLPLVGRGAATTARPAMLSDLSETIVRSVSDYYELLLEKGRLTFLVIKQASRELVPKL